MVDSTCPWLSSKGGIKNKEQLNHTGPALPVLHLLLRLKMLRRHHQRMSEAFTCIIAA